MQSFVEIVVFDSRCIHMCFRPFDEENLILSGGRESRATLYTTSGLSFFAME